MGSSAGEYVGLGHEVGVSAVLSLAMGVQVKEVGFEEVAGERAGMVEMVTPPLVLMQGLIDEEGEVEGIENPSKKVENSPEIVPDSSLISAGELDGGGVDGEAKEEIPS